MWLSKIYRDDNFHLKHSFGPQLISTLQAIVNREAEGIMQICSNRLSLWMAAYIPDLLGIAFGQSCIQEALPDPQCSLVSLLQFPRLQSFLKACN